MENNLFLKPLEISPRSLVSDIVAQDYRTADVFRKHGIGYCCPGKSSIETACIVQGVNMDQLIAEVHHATRSIQLSPDLPYFDWSIDFLIDYIINIHHYYLRRTLPGLNISLKDFAATHKKQYPHFSDLHNHFEKLGNELIPHLEYEEGVIFPYLRQVAHVYDRKESFGSLFIKTLRKPLSSLIDQEHELLEKSIYQFRQLTGNYKVPEKVCAEHVVVLSKLKALDDDLVQHMCLENEVLFPKVLVLEEKLLSNKT